MHARLCNAERAGTGGKGACYMYFVGSSCLLSNGSHATAAGYTLRTHAAHRGPAGRPWSGCRSSSAAACSAMSSSAAATHAARAQQRPAAVDALRSTACDIQNTWEIQLPHMPAAAACRADAGPSALPHNTPRALLAAPLKAARSVRAWAALPPPACITCVLSRSRYATFACEKITSRLLAAGMQRVQHALA